MKKIYNKLFLIMLLLPFTMLAQSTLDGTVVDQKTKQPIPGVNVVKQGSPGGAQTDFDGKFKLSDLKSGDKVVFSYIGYRNSIINYTGQQSLVVSLEEDSNELKEVVVQVGYGSVKKKDATGSVTVISAKDFNKGAIVSADQLLAGKAAGVRITNNGGQPDSAPNIRIRGGSSISANNNPLIVIDGIPIDNTNPAGVSNPLSLVNPNDIESFSVLKDASATAIYGSRASNGVIIITTKKGTSKEAQFNFSSSVTSGVVGKQIDVMDGKEFTRFVQEFHPSLTNLLGVDDPSVNDDPATVINEGIDNPLTPEIEGRILADTNWQDQIYRNSFSSDHNFSARANLYGKIPFRASIGYLNNQGVVKTNDYERFSYSLRLNPSVLNNHLKIDINAKGTYSDKNAIDDGGAIGGAISMDPTKPVYDNSGTGRFGNYFQNTQVNLNTLNIDGSSNPLALLEQRTRPERATRFLGNVEFDYKMHFLPELRAVVNLGIDASTARILEYFSNNSVATYQFDKSNPNINSNFLFNPGKNYLENQTITNTTFDSYLMYAKTIGKFVNKFDVQVGYSNQYFKNDGNKENYRYNIVSGVREENINPNNIYNRFYSLLNLQSFFGRSNIDLGKKYLLTLSMRADGSSLFLPENRWGYFPGVALAWRLKEENFLKNSSNLNDLKIRLGWGKTGQQDITSDTSFYPSVPLFDVGSNTSQYLDGVNLYSARAFNPNLTWEKTTTNNIGIDFDLFKKSIITGSVDVYSRKTNDLLARVPLPAGQSLSDTFVKNVGSTKSEGFEVNLSTKIIDKETFSFSINSNVSFNKSTVESFENVTTIPAKDSGLPIQTGVSLAEHVVGYQPRSAWVYEQIYDSNGRPAVGAFVDRNGDGIISNSDRYYVALVPNWTYGFGLNLNYKNFDLTTSFRGQIGGQVYNSRRLTSGWTDKVIPVNSTSLTNVLDFYNGAADIGVNNIIGNIPFSDYFLEDASFLRCDNIVLGYKFNKFFNTKSFRIYAAVNNAFLITKYSGQDPENFNSIDNNFYPRPRMYTFGLSLDF